MTDTVPNVEGVTTTLSRGSATAPAPPPAGRPPGRLRSTTGMKAVIAVTGIVWVLYLVLHAAVPLAVALACYRRRALVAFAVMTATMLIDLDHLLADPVYDPNRCSVGFHPLHAYALVPVYAALAFFPRTRWVGLGLVIHLALDALDCVTMM